ncbi:MAG: substrate-binding periplasmic protein [Cellvibrionaceae bacterium]
MSKTIHILLVSLIMSYTTQALAVTKVVIYGDDGYTPYSYKKGGKMAGIDSKIIEEVGKRIPDYEIILKPIPWKEGLKQLESGEIGFLYPPYYRPKMRPYMAYSDEIMTEKLVMFCRTELVDKGLNTFPDDFSGLVFGKKTGYAPGEQFEKAAKEGIIEIVEIKETKAILNKMMKGDVDCYTNDRLSVLFELKQMQSFGAYDGKSIKEAMVISLEKVFLGVTKKTNKYPYLDDFIGKFNKALNEMKAEGVVEKIINE